MNLCSNSGTPFTLKHILTKCEPYGKEKKSSMDCHTMLESLNPDSCNILSTIDFKRKHSQEGMKY